MTITPGPLLLLLSGAAVAAVGVADPATVDPALQFMGIATGGGIGIQALMLFGRTVSCLEAIQRDGITIRHDHGGAVSAVSDLGEAVRSHAGAVEATCEVEREPAPRARRSG